MPRGLVCMHENNIGTLILDAAFQVHKELGPGLLRKHL
jgi:hypothetical protein